MTPKPTTATVPKDCQCAPYLTPGKVYEITGWGDFAEHIFFIKADDGMEIPITVRKNATILNGADWILK